MSNFCPDCGGESEGEICPVHGTPTLLQALPDDAPERLIGQTFGGRYKLGPIIGRGGFGTVFRATQLTTLEDVVVKVLKPEFARDPLQVQRFLNEGRATVKLKSQHTVRVIDFAQTELGQLYIAMELLHGQELARVLQAEGALEPLRAMHIAVGVLKSLAEAHHVGLVHRDLKPENIFLCEIYGEPELVKLIDFGIAKSFSSEDQDLTKAGFAVGTPKYMSPEQVRAEVLDGRSDLYALGVILYQTLAGEVPFHGANAMATLVMHLNTPPPALARAVKTPLPEGLADVVHKALAKETGDRFVDAEDMRAALETVLERAGVTVAQHGRAKPAADRGLAELPDAGMIVPAATQAGEAATSALDVTIPLRRPPQAEVAAPAHAAPTLESPQPAPDVAAREPVADLRSKVTERAGARARRLRAAASGGHAVFGSAAPPAANASDVARGVAPRPAPVGVARALPGPNSAEPPAPRESANSIGPWLVLLVVLCASALWWVSTRPEHQTVGERLTDVGRIPEALRAKFARAAEPDNAAPQPTPVPQDDGPLAAPHGKNRASRSGR